jgi:2-alkyl-3-oxoalkanoate reductase
MDRTRIVVLGARGFLGAEVVRRAAERGQAVTAVMRPPTHTAPPSDNPGLSIAFADAADTEQWIDYARGAAAVIDLIQPALTGRITQSSLNRAAEYRASLARRIGLALQQIPSNERPRYLSVSGLAELEPTASGLVNEQSRLRSRPTGFGVIGAAVARALASIDIDTSFVHLGSVYGPGKVFAERILPAVRNGRFPIFGRGDNHMSLIHVTDAADALLHIASARGASADRWIVTDGAPMMLRDFVGTTAAAIGAPRPKHIPRWLGALVAGGGLVDQMTKDVPSDPSALVRAGWRPAFPTFAAGLAATLDALGTRSRKREAEGGADPVRSAFGQTSVA